MGTPKDFWPIAVGALITTCIACLLVIINCILDGTQLEEVKYPAPTMVGFFKAFGSIMFAFAGASTFPTIQADMKNRSQFNYAAVFAILILFLIYFPMAAVGYFSLGSLVKDNIVLSMSYGWQRLAVEVMLLLHLVTAFPIITNPPAQMFEEMMNIPTDFNWKRCLFRSGSVFTLLFIAESVPSFGAILNLVGGSTVTLLTFVFPPYFYMKLADATIGAKGCTERKLPLWEKIYCWLLIILGIAGGACATYNAVRDIVGTSLSVPCYLMSSDSNITVLSYSPRHHLGLGDDGGGGGDSGDGSVDGSSDEAGGEGSSGVGSDDGGVVDDVVGGVGGGLGLSVDAGHVVDGVADLVADKTGLGDQVGLDGLVDGGGGDSDGDGGVDGLHVDGRDSVDSSDRGSVDGSNGGSSDSGESRGSGDSGHGSSGSDSRGSSVGKTVSGKANTSVAGAEETVAGDQLSISISSGGSHGGAEDGGKDNKGVHLDESC